MEFFPTSFKNDSFYKTRGTRHYYWHYYSTLLLALINVFRNNVFWTLDIFSHRTRVHLPELAIKSWNFTWTFNSKINFISQRRSINVTSDRTCWNIYVTYHVHYSFVSRSLGLQLSLSIKLRLNSELLACTCSIKQENKREKKEEAQT